MDRRQYARRLIAGAVERQHWDWDDGAEQQAAVTGSDALKNSGTGVYMSLNDTGNGRTSYRQNINGDLIFVPDSFHPTFAAMVIKNGSGNVGIGVGSLPPAHRLTIVGGPSWTSNGWKGELSFDNAAAFGWAANAAGNRFGIGQTNGGLYFFRTASDPGTAGAQPTTT